MKDTLIKLLSAYGATGREGFIREKIAEMVRPYADEMRVDAMGNLICVKKGTGKGKRVMLSAHMDQIGFVVVEVEKEGYLRVSNVGGLNGSLCRNRHVVFENGVKGVISFELRDLDPANVPMQKLFIDIGASSREEALSMIELGDVAVFAPDIIEMGDCISGPAMDNRVGCCVALEAFKLLKDSPNEVVCVFSTQEEVGMRGAHAAAYSVNPDIGVALDATLTGDTPKGNVFPMKLGEGSCVKIMDSSIVCTPSVVRKMIEAGEKCGAKFQREILIGGGTDSGAIQLTRNGIPSGVLSIPCRYVHSPVETVNIHDVESGVALLHAFLMDPTL